MAEEEKIKLVRLEDLSYYDDKMKDWVLKRITAEGGVGSLTPEELSELIQTEIEEYSKLIEV